ncbi:hypothetical protein TNCV_2043881, partial [Trichonephila clavipes]
MSSNPSDTVDLHREANLKLNPWRLYKSSHWRVGHASRLGANLESKVLVIRRR